MRLQAHPPTRLVVIHEDELHEDTAHLLRIIRHASRLLKLHGDDVDARILARHGAKLAAAETEAKDAD